MCYFLYLASPLTLSEVRSMLPNGLTADLASPSEHQTLRSLHPGTVTVARILAGRCSCDLVRARLADPRADERHLRERYRKQGLGRDAVITALERHRHGEGRHSDSSISKRLRSFVAEHARNAGPSLYYLHFSAPTPMSPAAIRYASVREVLEVDGWLVEDVPIVVRHSAV
jgi:GNAT superfamily N-acetyltransferase